MPCLIDPFVSLTRDTGYSPGVPFPSQTVATLVPSVAAVSVDIANLLSGLARGRHLVPLEGKAILRRPEYTAMVNSRQAADDDLRGDCTTLSTMDNPQHAVRHGKN